MIFGIQVALCDRFPALDPLTIRRTPMSEFCLLASRLVQYQRAKRRRERFKDWRPAGDKWF